MQMLKQPVVTSEIRLVALVEDILERNASGETVRRRQLSIDGDLIEIGMTSVDMVNLMLAVEAEFDVMIPPADITPENFRSIATIEALVCRLSALLRSP
jgi:acyl carrier protein